MNNEILKLYDLFKACHQNIFTDTRQIKEGAIFFALKGEKFNGNLFAMNAINQGAAFAVVDENVGEDERLILVDDVLKTLQILATYHRQNLQVKIIGIGGSNGKTTTKELLHLVLSKKYNTYATEGNFNNHIGVPLTLLKIKPEHEMVIVELGANKEGDIKELCEIAEPDFGVITNIGKEHLEGFGSIEGVAKAESELFDYLIKSNGFAFVNQDDVWLNNMSKRLQQFQSYSTQNEAIKDLLVVPTIQFEYKAQQFESNLPGFHNLQNIIAAIAIGEFFEVPYLQISEAIKSYSPKNNRSQFIETIKGNVILLDAYNANPSSVEMALMTFNEMKGNQKIIILGDMFELGDQEYVEHQNIVDLCGNQYDFQTSIFVGKAFSKCSSNSIKNLFFKEKIDAMNFVNLQNYRDSKILIKGSRGMKMEDFKDCF
jgi:UDP-N-acetylmuramoyl-tripeptide--D-alanyl-D-alanine ligase